MTSSADYVADTLRRTFWLHPITTIISKLLICCSRFLRACVAWRLLSSLRAQRKQGSRDKESQSREEPERETTVKAWPLVFAASPLWALAFKLRQRQLRRLYKGNRFFIVAFFLSWGAIRSFSLLYVIICTPTDYFARIDWVYKRPGAKSLNEMIIFTLKCLFQYSEKNWWQLSNLASFWNRGKCNTVWRNTI